MNSNPEVIRFLGGYSVHFNRPNGTRLTWVEDLTARKMKSEMIAARPIVIFPTRVEAEAEARAVIIPYLIKEKDVAPEDITGW